MTTLFVTYAGIVSYRFFFEEGEKKKVRSAFSQYMHPGAHRPDAQSARKASGWEEKKKSSRLCSRTFADLRPFPKTSRLPSWWNCSTNI